MADNPPFITGTPQAFNFTASGTVINYTGGGVADASTRDVLCVNSDNVVTAPGWTQILSRVSNQGSYIFVREGGVDSATINLGGGIASNTGVVWVRISGVSAEDQAVRTAVGADASVGATTPPLTSPALSEINSLALAFAALHNFTTTPASPVWSAGYTQQQQSSSVTGGNTTRTYGNVAVKVPAGTAAETPGFSWTNSAFERYMLFVSFLGTIGGGGTSPVTKQVDLRWSVLGRTSRSVDLRWAVYSSVSKEIDLSWQVVSRVSRNVSLRWEALERIAKEVDLRWEVDGVPIPPLPADAVADLSGVRVTVFL